MQAPYSLKPWNPIIPIDIVIVTDANGEELMTTTQDRGQQLIDQLNAVPVLCKAIEDAAIELWHTNDVELMNMASALEAAARIANPGFALATIKYPIPITEESELFAAVLGQDYALSSSDASEDNPAGS